jgi:hypothetical protein
MLKIFQNSLLKPIISNKAINSSQIHNTCLRKIPRNIFKTHSELNATNLNSKPIDKDSDFKIIRSKPKNEKTQSFNNNNFKQKNSHEFLHISNLSTNRNRKFKISAGDLNRDEKNFIFRGKSETFAPDDLDDQDPEELLKYEEDLNLFAKDENLYHSKIIEKDIKERNKIKNAIIKKNVKKIEDREKYRNTNLLTWDAKEQIKYLHLKHPEIWTVEKLADSFPITIESCKKLLRSNWAPKTLDDLIKHDNKVIRNWKLVTERDDITGFGKFFFFNF